MWFIFEEKGERGGFSGAMGDGVVNKFSGGEEMRPFLRVVGAKDVKISFYFLIRSFGLSIHLGVVGGGEVYIVLEKPCKFSCKGRHELRAMIRDDGVI